MPFRHCRQTKQRRLRDQAIRRWRIHAQPRRYVESAGGNGPSIWRRIHTQPRWHVESDWWHGAHVRGWWIHAQPRRHTEPAGWNGPCIRRRLYTRTRQRGQAIRWNGRREQQPHQRHGRAWRDAQQRCDLGNGQSHSEQINFNQYHASTGPAPPSAGPLCFHTWFRAGGKRSLHRMARGIVGAGHDFPRTRLAV